ncbi:MAG TPA: AAA family ATPase [Patescibacteria group bacterium]|nr:AAA family ATPase [Patescibacteria group bacterium]
MEEQMNNLKIISMDTIETEEIKWLWYPYIPYGKLTIVQGDPGDGKTTFMLKLASKLSNGKCFGDSEVEANREPINVIYQTAEDGLADTVKPRLETAGADCSRILVIDDTEQSLTMQDSRLEQALEQTGAKLLILDPIQAYLGENVDINRANETRDVTKRLAALASKMGCAIVLIGHMNKGSNSKAAYRGIGSIDFFAIARSVLLVARVPDQPSVRAVAQIKNNLAQEGDVVAFQLANGTFEWLGDYDISVEELLGGYSSISKTQKAEELLERMLSSKVTVPVQEIFEEGKRLGISKRTIENTKHVLGVKSVRVGAIWHWSLKSEE